MILHCQGASCKALRWMKTGLLAAGVAHLIAGAWMLARDQPFFRWVGWSPPDHVLMGYGPGILSIAVGICLLISSHAPVKSWPLVLAGFLKVNLFAAGYAVLSFQVAHPDRLFVFLLADDLIWWIPLAATLWAAVKAHLGRPFLRDTPMSLDEASRSFHLSTGETLDEAASNNTLVMVFLRHFGCTFTRKILRELEQLKMRAEGEGARLVLVHMLDEGGESKYIDKRSHVPRIADPLCELYQAFGLRKGGFLELLGPKVWIRWFRLMIHGCGVGHFAGDGLQMPGAFLFRNGRILVAQRAESQSDLPDLPGLFDDLPDEVPAETVHA